MDVDVDSAWDYELAARVEFPRSLHLAAELDDPTVGDTDVGDAWEYADSPEYPEAMTSLAYRYGINYLIYSLTH